MSDVPTWYFKAAKLADSGLEPAQIAERLGVKRPAVTRAVKEVRQRYGVAGRKADVCSPEGSHVVKVQCVAGGEKKEE